jgi:hypothetical protein
VFCLREDALRSRVAATRRLRFTIVENLGIGDLYMIRRWLLNFAALASLLLCIASAALWVHGRGRAEAWNFRPSAPFVIAPPDPSLPSQWCVQWHIYWGDEPWITVMREVRILSSPWPGSPLRIGYFSGPLSSTRWNPLPPPLPRGLPTSTTPIVRKYPSGGMSIMYPRTKPTTTIQFLRAEYSSNEREFAHFPSVSNISSRYVPYAGTRQLRIPLIWLFILFAVFPGVRLSGMIRTRRRRRLEGHCRTCGYDLTGNASGVCPECGDVIPAKTKC